MEASFQDQFVAALNLPHASDPFPTLKKILPEPASAGKAKHRNRIREKIKMEQ
jgi:hypothetical protein